MVIKPYKQRVFDSELLEEDDYDEIDHLETPVVPGTPLEVPPFTPTQEVPIRGPCRYNRGVPMPSTELPPEVTLHFF